MSELNERFDGIMRILARDIHKRLKREVMFHPTRKWRWDFADKEKKISVEIDGGEFLSQKKIQDPHSKKNNYDKMNNGVLLGWRTLRFRGSQLKEDPIKCIEQLKELYELK